MAGTDVFKRFLRPFFRPANLFCLAVSLTSAILPALVSHDAKDAGGVNPAGAFASLNHAFNPSPLGHDLSYQYGNPSGVPLVGNWDPPTSAAATTNNSTLATGWVPALYDNVTSDEFVGHSQAS